LSYVAVVGPSGGQPAETRRAASCCYLCSPA
jgi:hypothetical protein